MLILIDFAKCIIVYKMFRVLNIKKQKGKNFVCHSLSNNVTKYEKKKKSNNLYLVFRHFSFISYFWAWLHSVEFIFIHKNSSTDWNILEKKFLLAKIIQKKWKKKYSFYVRRKKYRVSFNTKKSIPTSLYRTWKFLGQSFLMRSKW